MVKKILSAFVSGQSRKELDALLPKASHRYGNSEFLFHSRSDARGFRHLLWWVSIPTKSRELEFRNEKYYAVIVKSNLAQSIGWRLATLTSQLPSLLRGMMIIRDPIAPLPIVGDKWDGMKQSNLLSKMLLDPGRISCVSMDRRIVYVGIIPYFAEADGVYSFGDRTIHIPDSKLLDSREVITVL